MRSQFFTPKQLWTPLTAGSDPSRAAEVMDNSKKIERHDHDTKVIHQSHMQSSVVDKQFYRDAASRTSASPRCSLGSLKTKQLLVCGLVWASLRGSLRTFLQDFFIPHGNMSYPACCEFVKIDATCMLAVIDSDMSGVLVDDG